MDLASILYFHYVIWTYRQQYHYPFPGNQIFWSVQYVQISLAKWLQEFDTNSCMLLICAIVVVLSDHVLMCLQPSHEFLYALIPR